jgi:hypothetical protein
VGIHFTFIDFGNPKILGQAYAIAPFIEIPLGKKEKPTRPVFRLSWGLSYLTKKFDVEKNHKNVAIGSHWNIFVQYRFLWHINLNEKFRFEPGIGLTHASNGRMQVPNLGLNLISLNLGLTYKLNDKACEKTVIDSCTKARSRHELLAWYGFGLNDNDPPGAETKMPAHTLSLNYVYNIRNTSKFGIGTDVFYEESYVRELNALNVPLSPFTNKLRLGIKGCYSYNVGRVAFPIEVGYYLYAIRNLNEPVYSRFGFRYTSGKGLMLQFMLKTHFAIAYHFDIGIGYCLPLMKK